MLSLGISADVRICLYGFEFAANTVLELLIRVHWHSGLSSSNSVSVVLSPTWHDCVSTAGPIVYQ